MAFKGKTMVGGMMIKPEDTPENIAPCWAPYITVDDVDDSARRVEKIGGKIISPTDIPDVGRFCVIQDLQGVYLNIISY